MTAPVFVVIVNYRTGAMSVDCLASLAGDVGALRGGRVIVADNDSRDDSVAVMRRAVVERGWSGWVEIVELPRNGGFAYGNNQAIARIRETTPEFAAVVLLNPDTLARPGTVARLVSHLEANPKVGVAGASIESGSGTREVSAHVMPSPLGELEAAASLGVLTRLLSRFAVSAPPSDASHECDWVSGACMAVRREVFESVGLFDEGFFLYYEEVDFCRRAREAGWACWFLADARVVHFEGASTGIKEARRRLPPYWFHSRRRFFLKAYGGLGLVAADLLWTLGRLTLVTRRAIGLGGHNGSSGQPRRLTRDMLASDFKAMFAGEWRAVPRDR